MGDKRRSKRLELSSTILMKQLDGEEQQLAAIEVFDVSTSGIGFNCETGLEMGHVYAANLTIWTKETLQVFLEIMRAVKTEEGYRYGAIFIGMPEMDKKRIEVYQTVEENRQ